MTQEYIAGFFSRDKKINTDPALFSLRVSYPHRLGGNATTGIPEVAMTYTSRRAAAADAKNYTEASGRTVRVTTKAQALREYNARKQAAYGGYQKNNSPKKRQKKA